MTKIFQSNCEEILKEHLFCTPHLLSAKVSPNGKLIAEIGADQNGISNAFLTNTDAIGMRKQITFFDSPEIIQFFWSADSQKVLISKDENGSGRLHLYGIDVHTNASCIYTEKFHDCSTKLIQLNPKENKAIIGINSRNPHFHDLYLLNLDSGSLQLIFENDKYAKFLFSSELKLILKMQIHDEDGSWTVFTRENEIFMELSAEDAFQTEFLQFNERKGLVYFLDSRFSNTNQLVAKPLSHPNQQEVLGFQPDSDIEEILWLDKTPVAFASYTLKKRWHVLDPLIKSDIAFLEAQVGSNFEVVSQDLDGSIWVIAQDLPDKGRHFLIYGRQKHLTFLHAPSSKCEHFSKMYEMSIEARDKEKLICYYTLPKEHDRGGYVDAPLPLVVVPHGGPFKARDRFEFSPFHQWLASCGYAVLSVNFRLSSGMGKAFVNAGNGQWGGKAHFDVIDAVEACIEKGITKRDMLAILGGSYGGYESLAALTFTPDYFKCCVAICGPSNLKTVLEHVPLYWEFASKPLSDKLMFFTKHAFITSMGGNPKDKKGALHLEKCSPLNHLDKITAPLLLIHGQNDHVVAESESRQIFEKMKENEKNVTYILFPDEGHIFAKFPNKMMLLNYAEYFLSQHLGGRYTPADQNTIADSSGIVFLSYE